MLQLVEFFLDDDELPPRTKKIRGSRGKKKPPPKKEKLEQVAFNRTFKESVEFLELLRCTPVSIIPGQVVSAKLNDKAKAVVNYLKTKVIPAHTSALELLKSGKLDFLLGDLKKAINTH